MGSAQAAVLQVSGGELTGALGVNVGGTLYDVQFVEGTCVGLFSGCDEASDFTFTSAESAVQASQELLNQVFLDVAQGNFDTQPELTLGCEEPAACVAFTPFAPPVVVDAFVAVGIVINQLQLAEDQTGVGAVPPATFD